MKTQQKQTALRRIIHSGFAAVQAVRKTASITLTALTLLLFALPAGVQAAVVVTTLAGSAGFDGSADGTGSAARFTFPRSVAVDSSGNVYVADTYNHTIRKVTPGGVVTTLAGSAGVVGSADGTGSAARFNQPGGVAVDSSGNVYVADFYNHTIRKVTPSGVVTTLAGTAGVEGSADGTGSEARFYYPNGVAVDSSGNVYVADYINQTIRKVTPEGVVTTLAGSAGFSGSADGTGSEARFTFPLGVAVDSSGNVYVADFYNHTIRKVTPSGVVTTLAGTAGVEGSADGTGSEARFYYPNGVAVDSSGNVYVADYINQTIRKVTPEGVVTTLAGSAGFSGSADGTGSEARFNHPLGVAVDSSGNVYVGDTDNSTIRKVTPGAETIAVVVKNDAAAGLANAKFVSFGNPAMNSENHTAFYGTITGTTPAATTALMGKTKGIWADDNTGDRQLIIRVGDTAAGTTSAVFSAMGDPVYNENEEIAFKGTLKVGVGGVTSTPALTANNIGIWSNTGGTLHLVARRAGEAPGCADATFASFTSLVLPDQGGVVMLANLNSGTVSLPGPGGVTPANNIGIWAADTAGDLQLIVRKGDTLDGKVITALSFLPAAAGVSGQSRSFSQTTGDLVYKATFADGSTGIYKVVFR